MKTAVQENVEEKKKNYCPISSLLTTALFTVTQGAPINDDQDYELLTKITNKRTKREKNTITTRKNIEKWLHHDDATGP